MNYPKPIQPPESLYTFTGDIKDLNSFTREQLRSEVEKARADAIEEAAKVCEDRDSGQGLQRDVEDMECAIAIRELLK